VGINKPSKATAEYSNGGNYPGGVLATRHARKDSNYEIGKMRKKQGKEGGHFYYQKLQCAMQRNIAKYRKV